MIDTNKLKINRHTNNTKVFFYGIHTILFVLYMWYYAHQCGIQSIIIITINQK